MISVRNELVHFKSADYYRIIPPTDNELLKSRDPSIVLRKVSNSWPFQLLTLSFARYCCETATHTIEYVKAAFRDNVSSFPPEGT